MAKYSMKILVPRIYNFWDWLDCKLADFYVRLTLNSLQRQQRRFQDSVERLRQYQAMPANRVGDWLAHRELRYITYSTRRLQELKKVHLDALENRRRTIHRLLPRRQDAK